MNFFAYFKKKLYLCSEFYTIRVFEKSQINNIIVFVMYV